ncbi:MAG: Asp-tRNA(Asn)/Glu-tRNA(Gln) amidotransferase subunit GatB, partial [Phreatobacter sp.]|uniref:Asp-tRNA(Asn)/Glu-tRNA(Gln) amidotransferase subunit GatB n=1 Tax=Phreatobacter sp. TaxID=1966341 RepID=UPI002733889B
RYLGTCDGDMEKGQLRCDANISVRPVGQTTLGTKVELKNLNSISFVRDGIAHEIKRQLGVLERGGTIGQETRDYDGMEGTSQSLRTKEDAHDYRYFPDPDLLPLEFTQAYVDDLAQHLPELPDEKKARFISQYGLTPYDASILVLERDSADYFEAVANGRDAKASANWVINELFGRLNKDGRDVTTSPVTPAQIGGIVDLIASGVISGKIAKDLFEIIYTEGGDPAEVVEARGMKQVTDTGAIEKVIDEVIAANPDKVQQAIAKPTMLGWFVGQVMKASGGKANPEAVNAMLKAKLGI